MNRIVRLVAGVPLACSLALGLAGVPVSAQTPTPESVEQARRRAREEADRAREPADRAREAAREVREQEAALRRAQGRDNAADRQADRGPEFTENFTRTIRIGRNGTLDLSNVSGDITVTGGGGDDLRIDAVKRVRRPSEQEARAILQEIQILVNERGNYVQVRTDYPRNRRNWSGGVDYTVNVPTGSTVLLNSVSGDLRVTNVRGGLRAETVSGNVEASSIGELRAVRSVSGDITLTDVQGQEVTAGTVSGDATIRNLKVSGLTFEAVSGDLRFAGVEIERAELRTISGDIELAGALARNGRYRLSTQSGDIRLTPANDTGFDLDASSFSGSVRSNITFRNGATVQTTRRGPPSQTLRGTVGDASAVVTLRSFSGDVTVNR